MTPSRRYPRTARLNEAMLEVLADEVERLSDPRLELVTITGVEVTRDLSRATVFFSTHIMQEVEAVCNRALIINRGKLAADGSPSELKSKFGCESLEDAFLKATGHGALQQSRDGVLVS